jgi:hypothetical protein
VLRWLCAQVVGGTLSAFTFLLLTGDHISDGPVAVRVTSAHGIHAGDVFVIAGWAVAMSALVLLARHAGRLRTP